MDRILATIATVGLTSTLLAGTALAHAKFQSSTPAPGSTVTTPPAAVTIAFTEDLASGSTGFMSNASRETVSTGATISTTTRNQMTIMLKPGLPVGGYSVFWHTVSADDGDTLDGSFSFSIAAASAPATGPVTAPAAKLPSTATLPATNTTGLALLLLALAAVLGIVSTRALRTGRA